MAKHAPKIMKKNSNKFSLTKWFVLAALFQCTSITQDGGMAQAITINDEKFLGRESLGLSQISMNDMNDQDLSKQSWLRLDNEEVFRLRRERK